jgi:hypothetical protein
VRVRVDQPGRERRAADVDHRHAIVGADLVERADRADRARTDQDGVAVEQRPCELAGEDRAGAVDEQIAAHDHATITSSVLQTSP